MPEKEEGRFFSPLMLDLSEIRNLYPQDGHSEFLF
jgi:hypothetical protein